MRVALAGTDPRAAWFARALEELSIHAELSDDLSYVSELMQLYNFDMFLVEACLLTKNRTIAELRRQHRSVPILVVGADLTVEQSVSFFADGVDEVVAWPGDVRVVAARMRAIVRRYRGAEPAICTIGPLSFDMVRRSLKHDGVSVSLTNMEYEVLEAMVLRKGTTLTKEALQDRLYGGREVPSTRTIDVFVCQLRKKLAAYGAHDIIETVRGLGYQLNGTQTGGGTEAPPSYNAARLANVAHAG